MKAEIFLYLVLYLFLPVNTTNEPGISHGNKPLTLVFPPDSLRDRQILYNGFLWENKYKRVTGDQFLFTNYFLPASVTCNGKNFSNIKIRYDIHEDEIQVVRNLDQIIRLNKELVDSFKITFNGRDYRFIKTNTGQNTGEESYFNVLYQGRSALYVKFRKDLTTEITDHSDGRFNELRKIYIMTGGILYPVNDMRDLYPAFGKFSTAIKDFIRNNKLKLTKKNPDSFIPVLKYYDTLDNKLKP